MDEETLAGHQKRMNVGVNFARDRIAVEKRAAVDLHDGALVVGGDGLEDAVRGRDAYPAAGDRVPLPASAAKLEPGRRVKGKTPAKSRNSRWDFED